MDEQCAGQVGEHHVGRLQIRRAQVADIVKMKDPANAAYQCAPARFIRAVRAIAPPQGMTGMRIWARGSTMEKAWLAVDDPATYPAWECAGDLGISVATNQNAFGPGLDQIRNILKRFPKVRLVIDHIGRPKIDEGPPDDQAKEYFALAEFPNCYLKLTLSGLDKMLIGKATADTFVPKLVSVFGANRIASELV